MQHLYTYRCCDDQAFEQLSAEERATIMVMAQEGQSLRAIARTLHRAPSTISREWRRHAGPTAAPGSSGYDAKRAGQEARRRRFQPRRSPKLAMDGVLFGVVEHFLREGLVARSDRRRYEHDVA